MKTKKMANREKKNGNKPKDKNFDADKYYTRMNKKNRDSYRKKQRQRKSNFS